jgi:hypothetical protein
MLLDSHDRIVSIGELDNFIDYFIKAGRYIRYPCSCGRPIRECAFFHDIQERSGQQGVNLDLHAFQTRLGGALGPGVRRYLFALPRRSVWLERTRDALLTKLPIYRRHVDEVFHRSIAIARAALEVSGKDVFVDTSKHPARVAHLHRRPEVDLHLIHVVRDVRAFLRSATRHGSRRSAAETARAWSRTHESALRLRKLVGEDRYLYFRWEDFCASPEAVLARICEFVGVEPTDLVAAVNGQPHHVIGNDVRLKPVRAIRADESWRESLTADQLVACERHAGELNRRFGYD